jgi:hypothetical protein
MVYVVSALLIQMLYLCLSIAAPVIIEPTNALSKKLSVTFW